MRRCVRSRDLKNEEAMARVGPQRHRKQNICGQTTCFKMFNNAYSDDVVVMRPYKDVCGRNLGAQDIQSVSGGKVSISGGGSINYSE